jgi:hypothetical protein
MVGEFTSSRKLKQLALTRAHSLLGYEKTRSGPQPYQPYEDYHLPYFQHCQHRQHIQIHLLRSGLY